MVNLKKKKNCKFYPGMVKNRFELPFYLYFDHAILSENAPLFL